MRPDPHAYQLTDIWAEVVGNCKQDETLTFHQVRVPPVWWTVLSLSSRLDLGLWFTSSFAVFSSFSTQFSLTRMRQKDDAESVRNAFQTPGAIDNQHPSAFSEHYTTPPASRRSLYGLPRVS